MGKLKKPCKNAYYFYVMTKKDEAEAMGHRVVGNFNMFSQTFGYNWSQLSKEEKLPYERMAKEAKEEEKFNINNKFTVTGESYAQVHQKQMEQKSAYGQMEDFIYSLVSGPEAGDQMFIFMKASYSIEQIIDRKSKIYWPNELSMAAFSLKGGIKSIYTQLVDTVESPTGYASQAKENCDEAYLPKPGDPEFDAIPGCRDYLRILKNINGFANHWLKDGYDIPGHRKVFFALDVEREPLVSCLQWLVNTLTGKDKEKYQYFVDNLKVYKISKLVLSWAEEANHLNPSYDNYLVKFKLETAADDIVKKGNYDYREEIVCGYHRLENPSLKMHNCAQSIVMRRIFMLFEEFVPAFKYEWCDRHKIDRVGKGVMGPVIKKKREKSPTREEQVKVEEPSWLKTADMDTWEYSSTTSASSTWGSRPSESATFETDEFPTLGASCGGGSSTTSGWNRRLSSSSASRSPPSTTYSGVGRGGAPLAPVTAPKSFMDDDDDEEFPALGAAGRGRGKRYR